MNTPLEQYFRVCEARGASDIHLSVGAVPRYRVGGRLLTADEFPALSETDLSEIVASLGCERNFVGSVDGALTAATGGRYRYNIYHEQDRLAIALRLLENRFRTFAELELPARLARFCEEPNGLVIVSGPTGAGKSTTLATMIDLINRTRDGHIITIEDPIEYVHTSARCLVHQRQVGRDTASFNDALVESLRQDPDVILVGEMRDLPTMRTALRAAETGHLVLTTLHAGDAVGAIERLISVFPAEEQASARHQLSLVLRGVFAQHLVSRKDGKGRIPAYELLVNTTAIANLIAMGRGAQIYSSLEIGAQQGMCTLDKTLLSRVEAGLIDARAALALARNPDTMRGRLGVA